MNPSPARAIASPGTEEELVAHPDQLAGTRLARVIGGSGDGALVLSIWSPVGTEVDIQVDRGLDILCVRHLGVRYGWAGPPGLTTRSQFEPGGYGWQRTFYGGLLTTCGLEHVGAPADSELNEQLLPAPRVISYGEHGRIAHSAAEIVERTINHEEGVVRVRGIVRQGAIYDERLELTRTIELRLDRAELTVTDDVRNVGPLPARHAILYHLNFGFPISQPGVVVESGTHEYSMPSLSPTAEEVLYQWDSDAEGEQRTEIRSSSGELLFACTQSASLPHLFLWAVPRSRTNVVGIAPSSTTADNGVTYLASGESLRYQVRLELGNLTSSAAHPR